MPARKRESVEGVSILMAGNLEPATVEEFAEKNGLTHRAAEVVLMANGPSRRKSDVGAAAFVAAFYAYRARRKGA